MPKEIRASQRLGESEAFSYSHLKAIAACAFLLLLLTFMKTGFDVKFFSAKKIKHQTVLTFEQLKNQFVNNSSGDAAFGTAREQLSLIDPSLNSGGEVLGLSSDTDINLPPVEEVFTEDILKTIKIFTYPSPSTDRQIKKYSEDILLVESKHNSLGLLSSLNSGERVSLDKVISESGLIIKSLSGIEVPKDLEKYHKYKLLYYLSMQKIAESFLQTGSENSVEDYSTIFFSIVEGMEKERSAIYKKYNIEV